MKVKIKILGLILLFLVSCRERTNIFDPGTDDFIPPPPISLAWPTHAIYDSYGYLIGIRFQVDFAEDFEKTLIIHNELYQDISMRVAFDVTVEQGDCVYIQDVYANYALGTYCLKIFFGGVPIGCCPLSIISEGGSMIVKGIPE